MRRAPESIGWGLGGEIDISMLQEVYEVKRPRTMLEEALKDF